MSVLILPCKRCGQRNRVPVARLNDGPRCGACRTGVRPESPLDVSGNELEGVIAESPLPVLVDFWAPWCGPCRAMAPALQQVATRRAGEVVVLQVNVDENPAAAARHGVSGIPSLLLFHRGREQRRLVGAQPPSAMEGLLDAAYGEAPGWN